MAKHKVDSYKQKKLRAQEREDAQAHKTKVTLITGGIIGAVLVAWLGYAVWDTAVHYPEAEKTAASTMEVNIDSLNDYMSGLYSE